MRNPYFRFGRRQRSGSSRSSLAVDQHDPARKRRSATGIYKPISIQLLAHCGHSFLCQVDRFTDVLYYCAAELNEPPTMLALNV
jgi:hypothetical protein